MNDWLPQPIGLGMAIITVAICASIWLCQSTGAPYLTLTAEPVLVRFTTLEALTGIEAFNVGVECRLSQALQRCQRPCTRTTQPTARSPNVQDACPLHFNAESL